MTHELSGSQRCDYSETKVGLFLLDAVDISSIALCAWGMLVFLVDQRFKDPLALQLKQNYNATLFLA